MFTSYQVLIRTYECVSTPYRLAVGDVIRCPKFRLGTTYPPDPLVQAPPQLGSERITRVAWRDPTRMHSYVAWLNSTNWGKDTYTVAIDESRASALFLITCILLTETCGPADVGAPCQLYRSLFCSRLSADGYLTNQSERISFVMDDPMSLCQPFLNEIEVVGCAELPIGWESTV